MNFATVKSYKQEWCHFLLLFQCWCRSAGPSFTENQPHPGHTEQEKAICSVSTRDSGCCRSLYQQSSMEARGPCKITVNLFCIPAVFFWCAFSTHCSPATLWSHSCSSWAIRCCSSQSPKPAAWASPQHQHLVLGWRNAPSVRPAGKDMLQFFSIV